MVEKFQKRFFIDERKENDGIRITENFFELNELQESENLPREVEARWRLVETAWDLNMPTNSIVLNMITRES